MKKWQDYRNFRKQKNPEGSVTFIITVDGTDVEVNEEIYKAYAGGAYKMEHTECRLKRNRYKKDAKGRAVRDEQGQLILLPEREVSLDKLIAEDWDFPSTAQSPEDIVIARLEVERLYACLDRLAPDERALIDALFFDELTEREYSAQTGIAQKTINDRKRRILGKLKKLMQN